MSLYVCSVNARGLRDLLRRKAFFLYCRAKNADFYFTQETHACAEDESFWKNQWGSEIWFSNGNNRSAGVAILKGNFKGQILYSEKDVSGRLIILVCELEQKQFIMVNIYATNDKIRNQTLFKNVEARICQLNLKFSEAKVLWGGDFNTVFDDNLDRWPPKPANINCELKNTCLRLGLMDIWRERNKSQRMYTWSNRSLSLQSRIDFWLISNDLEDKVKDVTIEPAVLTDHKLILIKIYLSNCFSQNNTSSYWKLNNSLLNNLDFKLEISRIIEKFWKQACNSGNYGQNWELTKFEIRKMAIKKGKYLAKQRRENESQVIKAILNLQIKSNGNLNEHEKENLILLQSKLDDIYIEKTKGAFVRSRCKWIEKGEKNTKYFFGLERRNAEYNTITNLSVNGSITNNHKVISKHVASFYQDLYSSASTGSGIDSFLNNISTNAKKINEEFREICDGRISLPELVECVKLLKDNKSPRNYGLTRIL